MILQFIKWYTGTSTDLCGTYLYILFYLVLTFPSHIIYLVLCKIVKTLNKSVQIILLVPQSLLHNDWNLDYLLQVYIYFILFGSYTMDIGWSFFSIVVLKMQMYWIYSICLYVLADTCIILYFYVHYNYWLADFIHYCMKISSVHDFVVKHFVLMVFRKGIYLIRKNIHCI